MVAPWTEYTDHNPLSVRLRVGQRWADTSRRKHSIPKPNLAKLSGTGPTAEALRKQWTQEVEARLRYMRHNIPDAGSEQQWEEICKICREVSFEVCGILHVHKGAPWLRNKGGDIQRLDQAILSVKQVDRGARRSGDEDAANRARGDLRRVRKEKAKALREWEVAWLKDKAEEANELVHRPNASMVFKVVKELTKGITRKRTDGGTLQGMNQREVEAWKEHFQAIQSGRGEIS